MADFSALEKVKVDGESTAEYTFRSLPGAPVIVCNPAGKLNKKFTRAVLRDPDLQHMLNGGLDDSKQDLFIKKMSNLIAETIIVDWRHMEQVAKDGGEKPTKQNKQAFIVALIKNAEYMFEDFISFAQTEENFVQHNTEETVKN